jgi:DUF4097 and DUF4098 domain-containing protein YvlB
LPAVLAVFTAGCELDGFAGSRRHTEPFHYRYDLAPGGSLSMENFNGSIEIEGGNQSHVEIDGEKYASTRDRLDRIRIEVTPSPDSIRIRTLRDGGYRGNGGARYRIRVPASTRLDGIRSSNGPITVTAVAEVGRLKTSNGPVHVRDSRGNADVDTSNGPVEIRDFQGPASVHTSNGPVTVSGISGRLDVVTSNGPVRAGVAATDSPVRLRTSNGPVTLDLETPRFSDVTVSTSNGPVNVRIPSGAAADVRAHTSNSSIDCDVENARINSKSRTSLSATLGKGGPLLDLATSNGPIHLKTGH